jgi:predicted small lipoprotein YifL
MTPARRVSSVAIVALLAALSAACGQQGPLTLPEEARPIERLPQPAPTEPESQDDERTRER